MKPSIYLALISLATIAACTSLAADTTDQKPLGGSPTAQNGREQQRPNIVFVLTDDQDTHLASLDYMPLVRKHLLDRGTYYRKHYCTTAVCCPSRVTLWTGKAAHNTNITDVNPPWGGYPKFVAQGFNENYLPVWLQQAGYNTYYTGKLFNVHDIYNYNSPYPGGFTGTDFLLDPFTYNYMNSTFQSNRDEPKSYEGDYSTDVLAQKAYGLLDEAVAAGKPFFLTAAPVAPHCDIQMNSTIQDPYHKFDFGPPVSAKRHEHLFMDEKVPRTKNFNPDEPSGVNWVRDLPKQNQTNVEDNDEHYRGRLRALQAVDELVEGLIERLEKHGIIDNTYFVYSSDNGYHIGQHRLQPGKSCGFEEDINIPLIIRGPGVKANETTDIVTTHTDLAPTFFQLLGISPRADFDGAAIPVTPKGIQDAVLTRKEFVNVEYWGYAGGEGKHDDTLHENNTYKAIRIIGSGYNLYYSIWCTNEHELYDMDNDPSQLNNLLQAKPFGPSNPITLLGFPISAVVARLDSLLFVLKSCKGDVCVEPWQTLHPDGNVLNLKDALSPRFDYFYEVEQQRVEFQRCENGYILDAEGPQFDREGLVFRGGLPWHEWV